MGEFLILGILPLISFLIFLSNNIEVDSEKGTVEIYCELRLLLYSMAVLNLNCSLEFVSSLSIRAFCATKSTYRKTFLEYK